MHRRQVNFDTMSETDVREVVVRPFLERLGYAHNTANDIKTERRFRYAEKFLGRPKEGKGISVEGIADYECIAGPFGKFIVEVKAPHIRLDEKVLLQAHSYAAHPEVNARYFLISNGRLFSLYATSDLRRPIVSWTFEEEEERFLEVSNYLSPEAIQKRAHYERYEPGRPLALGLGPSARISGGHLVYSGHTSNNDTIRALTGTLTGRQEGITGGVVQREADGTIIARVKIATPVTAIIGASDSRSEYLLPFSTASDCISSDPVSPTILVGRDSGRELSQPDLGKLTGRRGFRLNLNMAFTTVTEAIGYVHSNIFSGTFDVEWQYWFSQETIRSFNQILPIRLPQNFNISATGHFQLILE
ncbi:hypothetical protein sos41_13670 [Alphaproteobacteria bacterium SO-S41]|nr:hypothetical protein sos41_13670 [Alphaproteobacteria bacterium SO-S41]